MMRHSTRPLPLHGPCSIKQPPTTTEVVTALLDLSEAMQALNIDESTDALR